MPSIHEYIVTHPQHSDVRANAKVIATNMVAAGYPGYARWL